MSDQPQIPEAEAEAALRKLQTLAEDVLDTGPNLRDGNRQESMRLILRALVAVKDTARKQGDDFEQRYPGSYWYVDEAHLVAVAVEAEMNETSASEYHPYSQMAEGMLAFAAAAVVVNNAANLRSVLDAELSMYSAGMALTNMDVYQPPEPAEQPELDKPAT